MKKWLFSWFLCFALYAENDATPLLPARTKIILEGSYNTKQKFSGHFELFIPLLQKERHIFFADVRFLERQGAAFEGNAGLGYRAIDASNDWLFGLYSFYDRKRSNYHNFYNQVTVGMDLSYQNWWLTVNGYFPFGKTSIHDSEVNKTKLAPSQLNGFYNIFYLEGKEVALTGFDAELGYDFPKGYSLFLGGYYFNHSLTKSVAGPRIRYTHLLNAMYERGLCTNNNVYLEGIYQYDQVRRSQWIVSLRVELDIGRKDRCKNFAINRRLTRYIQRDVDIITAVRTEGNFQRLNKANGQPVEVKLAETPTDLDPAILAIADVVAVQNEISINSFDLPGNTTLTGGSYFFGEDFSIVLSPGGRLKQTGGNFPFVNLVGENYTIRDIHLQLMQAALPAAIGNSANQAVGEVLVDNIQANSGVDFVVFSGTNSVISVTNSTFDQMLPESQMTFETKTKIVVPQFNNNIMNFGESTIFSGVVFVNDFSPNTELIVNEVLNNTVSFPTINAQTAGFLFFNFQDAAGSRANMQVGKVKNNVINFGVQSNGLIGIAFSNANSGVHSTLTVEDVENNIINIKPDGVAHTGILISNLADMGGVTVTEIQRLVGNQINVLGSGVGHIGVQLNAENKAAASQEIFLTVGNNGGFKNNSFTFSNEAVAPIAIDITNKQASPNTSKITVDVQDFGNSLGQANGGVTPQFTGTNIEVNP